MISLFHGENTGSSPVGRASDFNGLATPNPQNQRLYGKYTQKCFFRRLRFPPFVPVQTICAARKKLCASRPSLPAQSFSNEIEKHPLIKTAFNEPRPFFIFKNLYII